MARAPAIGIDLGTTYCCVAVYKDGDDEAKVIPNDLGKNTTPSYIAYEDDDIIVGETAKDQAYENPQNTIFDVKRLMGKDFDDPYIQKDAKLWPFDLVQDEHYSLLRVKAEGKHLLPQDITKELISYLKKTAEDCLGCPVKSAVVTVPAYFNDLQRRLTIEACEKAGLHILQLVSEPTAASVAYSLHKKDEYSNSYERNCLIFDLGGGTFDVAVLTIISRNFIRIKGLGGDARLGGEDFDNVMCDYCIQHFEEENGINLAEGKDSENPRIKLKVARRLRRIKKECEKQKCFLSEAKSVVVSLAAIHGDIDLVVTFTRELFEQLIEDYLNKCISIVDRILEGSGMGTENIHDVVLIGGSSRIPKIQKMLKEYFGKETLSKSINPDEAVACGAAIQAYYAHNHDLAGIVIEEPKVKQTHTQIWTSDSSQGSLPFALHDILPDSEPEEILELEGSSSDGRSSKESSRRNSNVNSPTSNAQSPSPSKTPNSQSPSPVFNRSVSHSPISTRSNSNKRFGGIFRSVTHGQLNTSILSPVVETNLHLAMHFSEDSVKVEDFTNSKFPPIPNSNTVPVPPFVLEPTPPVIAFKDKIRIGKDAEKYKHQESYYNVLDLIIKERNKICQLTNSTKEFCILFEEEIIAAFLSVIKKRIEKQSKGVKVTQILFTFPFVCSRVQKERIKIAAALAGIENTNIRIFSNLTLTAISYANFRKSLNINIKFDSILYLVIQYGPGFLSSALIEHTPNLLKVKSFYSSYLLDYETKLKFLTAHGGLIGDHHETVFTEEEKQELMEIHLSILNKTCPEDMIKNVDMCFIVSDKSCTIMEEYLKKHFWHGTTYSFTSKSGPIMGASILHSKNYSLGGGTRIHDGYSCAEFKCVCMNQVKVKSLIYKEVNGNIIVGPEGEVFRHFIELDLTEMQMVEFGSSFLFSLEEFLEDRFYSEICSYRLSITMNKGSRKTLKKYTVNVICIQDEDGVCHLTVEEPPVSIADAINVEFFRTDKLNSELKNIGNRKSSFHIFFKTFQKKRWGLPGKKNSFHN